MRARATLIAVTVSIGSIGVVGVGPTPVASAAGLLTLVSQDFNVAADGVLRFTVEFSDDTLLAALPSATLVVTAYRTVTTRDEVADALKGTLPRSADSVDLPLAQLSRVSTQSVIGAVQLESSTRTPEMLQMSAPGLYPMTLEVRDGNEVIADLITFVHRLPGPTDQADDSPENELRLALAMRTASDVLLDSNGEVRMNDSVIDELTHLADVLEAIEPSGMPAAVSVPPAWLQALVEVGEVELANRIAAALVPHDLLSAPRLPLDASQAADVGLQAVYTEWLRDGDDILVAAVAKTSRRTTTFVTSLLGEAGASLHRDLGSRLLVMTTDVYDELPNSLGIFTDTTRLATVQIASGVSLEAAIPDREVSALLATESDQPTLTAITVVANLLAARLEILDADELPSRRSVTLATPDLSLPATTTVAAVASLLAATPGFNAATFDEVGVRTDHLTNNGNVAVIGLPDTVGGSLAGRLAPEVALLAELDSTVSMLPLDDKRPAEWTRVIGQLPTSALTDEQASGIIADVQEQLRAIRQSVEIPLGFSFTLTGRRTTVPIKLHNTSDVPLTVRVRMTSQKLLFPGGPQTVTLPPQSFFNVEVPIEVRTNGRFPVTLEVFTPDGKLRLAPPVPLTARVNAISGLGNLVSGVLLLVVIAWWARHVRNSRRRRLAQRASLNHPLRGGDLLDPLTSDPLTTEHRETTNLSDL